MGVVEFRERPTEKARELRNSATPAEQQLWSFLRRRGLGGVKFSRQMPVGPYICDLMCREHALVVELDGEHHARQAEADAARTTYIEQAGYRMLRFWNDDVMNDMDVVLETIAAALKSDPPPTPSRKREGEIA